MRRFERLAAGPGRPGRGYLSVLAQYYAEVRLVRPVPKIAFWPAPKVESAIIHLEVRGERALRADFERRFLRFVHSLFTQPRKMLKNVAAGIRGEPVENLWQQLGFPSNRRAQEMTQEDWLKLYQAWK